MREILFRGKRIDNGEWIEGMLVIRQRRDFISPAKFRVQYYTEDNLYTLGRFMEVVPSTVCQYTGLTDKNGKKIFEGDIVHYLCSHVVALVKFGEYKDIDADNKKSFGYYVQYREDEKTITENMDLSESDKEYGCEVIGNIYDNPELLEDGK